MSELPATLFGGTRTTHSRRGKIGAIKNPAELVR
jgi:hypothetical protein